MGMEMMTIAEMGDRRNGVHPPCLVPPDRPAEARWPAPSPRSTLAAQAAHPATPHEPAAVKRGPKDQPRRPNEARRIVKIMKRIYRAWAESNCAQTQQELSTRTRQHHSKDSRNRGRQRTGRDGSRTRAGALSDGLQLRMHEQGRAVHTRVQDCKRHST
eukprot:1269612-Pleurochrysis_carterae.AAC.3